MKKIWIAMGVVPAISSLGLSLYLFLDQQEEGAGPKARSSQPSDLQLVASITEVKSQLNQLSSDLEAVRMQVGAGPDEDIREDGAEIGEPPVLPMVERISLLESSLASLQENYNGISIEVASDERQKIFASPDGVLRADEYYEAGKFSIAAEGYLTYYRNYPDGPDSRGVLDRARRSYRQAGYQDMAIWVQEEMMRLFPENRVTDLTTLAEMEKDAGLYDAAIEHSAEAAELMPETQSRLWQRMYWAWYNQLRDGNEAGLEAYRTVKEEIRTAGFPEDHKLNQRVNDKIEEIVREQSNRRRITDTKDSALALDDPRESALLFE